MHAYKGYAERGEQMICKWENERQLCTNSDSKHYCFLCIGGMNLECKDYEKRENEVKR